MSCKTACIGDVAAYRKTTVKPLEGTLYNCYSLPAFDNNRTPETLDGSAILSSKLHVEKGDILVNKLNMRFKRIWPLRSLKPNSICSTEFMPLVPNDSIDPRYLLYVLTSDRFTNRLSGMRTGTSGSHQRVKPEWILEYSFPLPDMIVQERIGSVLGTIDEKIALNNQLNGYLEEACDAIYSSFAVDSNFDSGILADLVEVKYGKDHKKLGAGDIPVYGSGGFMRSVNDWLYQGESVLIPRKGSLNNVMFVNEAFWTVDTMFYTVPTCPGAAKYVYQFIKRVNLASMNSGSAVPSMTTDILNSIELPVPGVEQLTQFDSALEPYYSAIRLNRTESSRLADLRDALLPKLMSGEIDVSKVDLTQLNSHLGDC